MGEVVGECTECLEFYLPAGRNLTNHIFIIGDHAFPALSSLSYKSNCSAILSIVRCCCARIGECDFPPSLIVLIQAVEMAIQKLEINGLFFFYLAPMI